MSYLRICALYGIFITIGVSGKTAYITDEEKLLRMLFEDYNPEARPVINSTKTVIVDMQFSLLQIKDLNARMQVLTTRGHLVLQWYDERLTWDANSARTPDQLFINPKFIWKPEFATINGVGGLMDDYSDFQAVLYSNGTIHWEPGNIFDTECAIDITFYPFDTQYCSLVFGAWSYYTAKMNLTTHGTDINLGSYNLNGEWEILDTSSERHEFAFECCPHQRFSNIEFKLHLRRMYTFYIMNVVFPGIMTSATLLSIFFCPPTQKMHIGIVSLLSFRLFLISVSDSIPRTSDHVPLLGVYLTSTMAVTTLTMVATVFVLNLYSMKDKPVPHWAKKLFLIHVAQLICMRKCTTDTVSPCIYNKKDKDEEIMYDELDNNVGVATNRGDASKDACRYNRPDHACSEKNKIHAADRESKYDNVVERNEKCTNDCRKTVNEDVWCRTSKTVLSLKHRPQSEHNTIKKEEKPNYNKEWINVAAVFDRLFFVSLTIAIIAISGMLFSPLFIRKLKSLELM